MSDLKSGTSNLEPVLDRIEIIKGNFLNKEIRKKAIKDIDFVFYNISTTNPQNSILNPAYDVESNVIGTIGVLKDFINTDVRKILFTSSRGTVYGKPSKVPVSEDEITNPICPYGIPKLVIEGGGNASHAVNDFRKIAGKAAGCAAVLLDKPYNQAVKVDYRVENLEASVELIKSIKDK